MDLIHEAHYRKAALELATESMHGSPTVDDIVAVATKYYRFIAGEPITGEQ